MKFVDALKKSVKLLKSESFIERVKEEDEKMLEQIPQLIKINSLGFLTTNSQAGNMDKKHKLFERAYITGFMLGKMAEKFIKLMGVNTDKNAIFIPHCTLVDKDIPSSLDIPVTIGRSSGKIIVHTHLSSAIPTSVWNFFRKEAHINVSEKVVFIQCWDPIWGRLASERTGLFTDIINVLKKISVE